MAESKKSFVLYADLLHTVRKMPLDKAGLLLVTILQYVNDLNPSVDDMLVDIVFEPIKQQMKRDLMKWDATRTRRSEAGKASAEAKKKANRTRQKTTNSTLVEQEEQTSTLVDFVEENPTKSTVNANATVNVTVIKEVVVEEGDYEKKILEDDEEIIIPETIGDGIVNEEEKIAAVNFLKNHSMFALIQKQQTLKPPEVIKLFETFYETKSVLKQVSGKSKDEVLQHFLFWVPKYIQATKPTTSNANTSHIPRRNNTVAAGADEKRADRKQLVDSLRGLLRGTEPKE